AIGGGDERWEVAEDRVAEALSADADESGRADEDVLGSRVGAGGGEGVGGGLGGQGRRLVAEVAGVAVRSSGVEDDSAGLPVGRGLLGPQNGVGLAPVRGVDGGDGVAGSGV